MPADHPLPEPTPLPVAPIAAQTRWSPDRAAPAPVDRPDTYLGGMLRGARNRCPVCGEGKVFAGYLKVVPECSHCGARLGALRADDAPPYFTIFVAGHVLVPLMLWVEKAYMPPIWLHMVIWLPVFAIACILLLRPIKGAVVGWMLRLGFGEARDGPPAAPRPAPGRADG